MRAQHFIKDAQQTWAQTDKKLQGEYTNQLAYQKEMRILDNALATAEEPIAYDSAAQRKVALNKAAIKRGMEVDPVDPSSIPPFMTPEQRQAVAAQREAVAQAQAAMKQAEAAPMGMWDGIRSSLGLNPDSTVMGIPVTFDKEQRSASQV
jgi:hypothetical protein